MITYGERSRIVDVFMKRRDQWLAYLRDPSHKQARMSLRRWLAEGGMGECCLGAACTVSQLGYWDDTTVDREYVINDAPTERESSYAPIAVHKWYGLYDHQGSFHDGDTLLMLPKRDFSSWEQVRNLTHLNDTLEYTFADIAMFIEQNQGMIFWWWYNSNISDPRWEEAKKSCGI